MSYRFLALGDSYTVGEGVPEHERWPRLLAGQLRERGYAADVTIVAKTGWTTGELAEGIRCANPQGGFDLVSLLIGVNNQYRGLDLDAYRAEFSSLLRQSIRFAGGNSQCVLVLSIPDWSVTPFAEGRDRARLSRQIDAFNAVNRSEAERAGVWYVDVTPVSRRASADASLLAADGLHPSGRMYFLWAQQALSGALQAMAFSKSGTPLDLNKINREERPPALTGSAREDREI